MTGMANPRALWAFNSTPPTLPLQRGGKRRPFCPGSSPAPCSVNEWLNLYNPAVGHNDRCALLRLQIDISPMWTL